ncbi:DUF3943 domain-containing protein [Mucilaginibacter sp.]|uniref:DUF3943 domain-containing protein n=1 Tax=Mucilaginibacter sp. TaxID=1882438 RepID=UPI00284027A5|nr:DUF3943 domain-containing protein [Mucilaginibacter sp.]MDR3697414.1 DUF3943 domain-containing protein [Mucilaginibacter sp.]
MQLYRGTFDLLQNRGKNIVPFSAEAIIKMNQFYLSLRKTKCTFFRRIGILFFLIFSLAPFTLFAQFNVSRLPYSDTAPKYNYRDTLVKKRFGRSVFLLSTTEALPWLFDRYIAKADWANISFKTVGNHLNPNSWFWDTDDFLTNQFAHPSHGSIFFNSFRSNGYSFWQSVPATFAGSYVWETAGENQAPSINDFINTGFGGSVLGEITHRFANKIINNRSRGFKRQASEVVGFIINPANGLNRIMDGKWGKVYGNANACDSTKVYFEIDGGMRRFSVNNHDGGFSWYGRIKLLYGTPFENYRVPFSFISINTELGKSLKSNVNLISAYGSLTGFWVQYTDKSQQMALLTANYDYINNDAFFYSSENIKLNLFSKFKISNKIKISTTFGTGPILLAAVPDPYPNYGRDYDFCWGAGLSAGAMISLDDRFFYGINYRGAWFKTYSGNASDNFLHTVTSELGFKIIKRYSISAEPGYFALLGHYKHYPGYDKTYPYLRISIRFNTTL